jgi:hypothetical protein
LVLALWSVGRGAPVGEKASAWGLLSACEAAVTFTISMVCWCKSAIEAELQ